MSALGGLKPAYDYNNPTDRPGNVAAPYKPRVTPETSAAPAAPVTGPTSDSPLTGLKPGYDYNNPSDRPGGVKSPSAEVPTGNSLLYDIFHPTDADLSRPQTWHDWLTKTYSPSAKDVGSAALDDVSFGTADAIQHAYTGEDVNAIRARTGASQAALGPMGPVVNALTYAIPGGGEAKLAITPGKYIGKAAATLAPKIGRYGAAAAEGAAASGASSLGHQTGQDPRNIDLTKVATDAGWGAAGGVVAQGVGDAGAAVGQRVADYVTGKGGPGSEQWPGGANWRDRAASGQAGSDSVAQDAALYQNTLPPSDPAQPALAKLQGALSQSTEPGNVAHAATGLAGWGAAKLAGGDEMAQYVAGGVGPFASKYFVNPVAGRINKVDRNINVGQSFDQLYPALTGNPASTTDTSGWANAIRQGWIGGERPDQGAAQGGGAQWW